MDPDLSSQGYAAVQDWQNLFDPGNATGGQMPAVQIMWDCFTWSFGDGQGAVLMLMIPLIASYGSSMSTITAASRYPSLLAATLPLACSCLAKLEELVADHCCRSTFPSSNPLREASTCV